MKKFKTYLAVVFAILMVTALAVTASANDGNTVGLGDYSEQITAQFSNAASDILPIFLGVLGAGLIVFVVFKGIRLAKKMFGTVANG